MGPTQNHLKIQIHNLEEAASLGEFQEPRDELGESMTASRRETEEQEVMRSAPFSGGVLTELCTLQYVN
jgi:hypothetical protein